MHETNAHLLLLLLLLVALLTHTPPTPTAIHIPTQKLTSIDNTNSTSSNPLHSSSATTNSRQLNLSDLFSQIKHYSVSVRKDALLGLKDLLQKHTHVLTLECASILQIILPCILDEDKSVRAALLSLLSFILPTLGTSGIRPFLALINSYICSGLSHMHYTVKRTAVQVLRGVVELGTGGKSANSSNNNTSIHTSSNLFLWSSTHAQILPNLLSCLQDRIFFTRQANIATTEALAGKSASSSSSSHMTNAALAHANSNAANVGGNMMNRAQLLACIEAFLALCPDAKKEESLVGSAASSQNNTLSSAITPSFLYASSLHSLYSADSLSSAATSAPSGDLTLADQAMSLMPTRPVPMKYARKSGGGGGAGMKGNMMFASTTTTTSSTSSSTSSSSKPTLPINTFISQLLPLSIEYWLETFGLVSNSTSSGGSGGASSGSSGANSKINTTEYLSNLLSILKLIQLSLNILRNQAVEERRKMIVTGDGESNLYDPNSTFDHLNLPSTFLPSLRSHIFSLFPFTIETLKLMNRAAWNEQLQRNMNLLNVTCVEVMMMCFGGTNHTIPHAMTSQHEDATSSFGTSARRKSGSSNKQSRLQTIAQEDSVRLNKIVEYMNEAFQGLIERQGERKEGEEGQSKEGEEEMEEAEDDEDEDEDAKEEKTHEESDDEEEKEEDAEMEEDDDEEEDETKPASAAASTPSTPSRRPTQQSRKSLTPVTPNRSPQQTSSSSSAADKHSSLHSLLTLLPLLLPRLPQERQEELMSKFLEYYTIVHPLSNGKLECLMFLERYLLSAVQMTNLVDQYGTAVSQGMIWWQQNDFRTILFEEGELVTTLIQVMKAIGVEEEKRRDTMRGEVNEKLMQRFSQMYTSILTILLDCGRVFHQKVLDYNVLQTQVVKVFGELEDSRTTASITLGPFWSLSLDQQRGFLNLLYYFDVVDEELVRVIYACIKKLMSERSRQQQEEKKDDEPTHSDSLPSIHLVLDMLHEKHSSFTNGVAGYITLLISLIRWDTVAVSTASPFSTSHVSSLLPKVCTQLRSITDDELNYYAAVSGNGDNSMADANVNITLLDILSPILEECMDANLNLVVSSSSSSTPSAVQPKFDFYTIIILLDCLLPSFTSSTAVPISPRLLTLLPRYLWTILSNTLSSSLVESGEKFVVGLGSNLMHFISSSSSQQQQQPWLLPMKLLLRLSHTSVAADLIQLMQSHLTRTTDGLGLSTQVVIVITAIVRCASLRPLLHHHSSLLLPLVSRIRATPNIASQTLLVSLQSEVTMMFGQQATK